MKLNNKYIKGLLIAVAAFSSVALTSCEDEPDKFEPASGKPTIKYIRCMSTEIHNWDDDPNMQYTDGQLVTSASPGNTLAIIGENMRSVYEVWFNDLQASLNQSSLTDNTLFVTVPSRVPGEVTDKIYFVTTSKDTVAYDFKVIISAPIINSMANEYAKAGTIQSLKGNYFIDDPGTPLSISFTGNNGSLIPAEIVSIASDFTSVDIVVPEGAVSGPIVARSVYGTTKSAFWYKDNRGMLFDFDGLTGLGNHGWHARDILSDETSISGNFVQLGNGTAKLGAEATSTWDDGNFSFEYWPGNWQDPETYAPASDSDQNGPRLLDLVDFSDWENMSLKFELYIPSSNPWSAQSMQIIFAGVDQVSNGAAGAKDIYGNTLAGANNSYFQGSTLPRILYRPWTSTGSFDTGDQWQTITLPLKASLIYGADGTSATSSISKDSFASLVIFVWNGGIDGTDCQPIIKIDNIRVVPNK